MFFTDRINIPLLMPFGDIDDAVPWLQGIEIYLAMRRLDKNVILLHYEGEPAAKWMVEGEGYREKKEKK